MGSQLVGCTVCVGGGKEVLGSYAHPREKVKVFVVFFVRKNYKKHFTNILWKIF